MLNLGAIAQRYRSFALNWKTLVRLAGDFHRVEQADFEQEASRTQQHLGLIAARLIVLTVVARVSHLRRRRLGMSRRCAASVQRTDFFMVDAGARDLAPRRCFSAGRGERDLDATSKCHCP